MIEEWKQLSSEELMDKKDAIETEISAYNAVLENVSSIGLGAGGRFLIHMHAPHNGWTARRCGDARPFGGQ